MARRMIWCLRLSVVITLARSRKLRKMRAWWRLRGPGILRWSIRRLGPGTTWRKLRWMQWRNERPRLLARTRDGRYAFVQSRATTSDGFQIASFAVGPQIGLG